MTLDERQLKQRLTRFWDAEARYYDPADGRSYFYALIARRQREDEDG